MASRTFGASETSDLGSASSTNDPAKMTGTAVMVTKKSTDPLRFIRANAGVPGTKTPPLSAVKSPSSANRKKQEMLKDKDREQWEDDGSSEWRDSFSSWIGKRKSINANSVALAVSDSPGSDQYPIDENETVPSSGGRIIDETPRSSYRSKTKLTWKSEDVEGEQSAWGDGTENEFHPSGKHDTDTAAQKTTPLQDNAVPSIASNFSKPVSSNHTTPVRTENLEANQSSQNGDEQQKDGPDERCLSVRDALKKYTAPTQTSAAAPPPVRPKPNVQSQPPPASHSYVEEESITKRAGSMRLAQNATETEERSKDRGVVEMDELTGLRKVSQFLQSVQNDNAYAAPSAPASYSDEYRPSATSTSPPCEPANGNKEPDDHNAEQDKMIGSVSADQTCAGCCKNLEAGAAMYIEKLRSVFHVHCFRCSICRDSLVVRQRCVNREYGDEDESDDLASNALTTVTVFIRDSKLLCGACFDKLPKQQHQPPQKAPL